MGLGAFKALGGVYAVAQLIARQTGEDNRTVYSIFQPDEENENGAAAMIADGPFQQKIMLLFLSLNL